MKAKRLLVVMFAAVAILGGRSTLRADFPNIFYFTQQQSETSIPGKLTLTYSPQLTETPSTGPSLVSADVSWINNSHGQHCYTSAMQHVSANNFTFAIDAVPGDTIDYFFTQHWMGQNQTYYAWDPSHQCANSTDTKWFSYVMGAGFEKTPAWPLIIEGSERYRNRHENEWRFDHFDGNYFQNASFNFKIVDWGDSLMIILFPSEPTNWANGRFFGMAGYDTLCDHDLYGQNYGSGVPQYQNGSGSGLIGPSNIPNLGMTENPFQATWTNTAYPDVRWYVWMLHGLCYGQYIDFELSAARTLSIGQLCYSEPQRYYTGLGKISHKFQHPWANAAGDATINTVTFPGLGFAQHVQNTKFGRLASFMMGKALFDTDWKIGRVYNYATPFDCNGAAMTFPDTTNSPFVKPDVLGPIYKNQACFACHFEEGKGYPEDMFGSDPAITTLSLCNLQVVNSDGSTGPHPVFGPALQTKAMPPAVPQGKLNITWEEVPGHFADSTTFSLRKPHYSFSNLGWGVSSINLDSVRISPRYIPHLSGLGMLEAVDESTVLSFVNLPGKAGTYIAGKAQRVTDKFTGTNTLGRFGWKCGTASLRSKLFSSMAADLGISNRYFANQAYLNGPPDPPELIEQAIDTMRMYLSLLAPPPRQMGKGYIIYDPKIAGATEGGVIWADGSLYKGLAFEEIWTDPSAIHGKDLFVRAKCDLCHIPSMRTGTKTDFDELKNLEIQPFTDLLLHDMGTEDGDNGYTEGLAGPSEWRTAPLWGLWYIPYVNKVGLYMHDGRARSIQEAILWHFGEGTLSRNAFIAMNAQERADLVRYTQYPFADRLPKFGTIVGVKQPGLARANAGTIPSLMCYPNPVRTVAMLRLENIVCAKGDRVVMSIYNLQGKRVFYQAVRPGQSTVTWNTATCGTGKYVAMLSAHGKTFRKNLLVMR
jgi:CxxC motif-containing protein (DUF1111 family)